MDGKGTELPHAAALPAQTVVNVLETWLTIKCSNDQLLAALAQVLRFPECLFSVYTDIFNTTCSLQKQNMYF